MKLLFQPAEEGGAGAKVMVQEGALQGVSAVFGLHVWPTAPSGHIQTRVMTFTCCTQRTSLKFSRAHLVSRVSILVYIAMLQRLQNVAVDLQLWQHVSLQVGTLMAGTDKFYIRVKGVGGHGGTPHLVKDTVVAASAVVMNLQPLVSRETDPAEGGIVGVTLINSGKLIVNALSLCTVTWYRFLVLDTVS